jgi:hypothetical protein
VPAPVFTFFRAIAEAHPDPIKFKQIKEQTRGLAGKNRTRDLKDRLPRSLTTWVKSGKDGYYLVLPAPAENRPRL